MHIIQLPYPDSPLRTRRLQGKAEVWDPCRRRFVALSPEEFVRQRMLRYLLESLKYPVSQLKVEGGIYLNGLPRRPDILVHRKAEPWMLVECKRPEQALDETVLQQLLEYNRSVPCRFLVMSNGPQTVCLERDGGSWRFLAELPPHPEEGSSGQGKIPSWA